MRIAVTNNGRNVLEQFDEVTNFTILEVASGKMHGKRIIDVSTTGGQEAIICILKNEGVGVLLCHEISDTTKETLEKNGIEVISGLRGNVHMKMRAYAKGRLKERVQK